MNNILVLDVETTIKNTGNPFTKSNKLCLVGLQTWFDQYKIYDVEYSASPYGEFLVEIQKEIENALLVIGFNIKFDLHWLSRYGITFSGVKIWDCQIAHFLISRQKDKYPSLNGVSEYYNLGQKEDKIAQYWADGIDTPDIPYDELVSYLKQDLNLTYKIYLKQKEFFELHPKLYKLFYLEMLDLLILQEMEFNGMRFDKELSLQRSVELEEQIKEVVSPLNSIYPDTPINWGSGDHLSAFLYGGTIKEKYRESFIFNYKDGRQVEKQRWSIKEHVLPRQVAPPKKSEYAKGGVWKADKPLLQSLKVPKALRSSIDNIILLGDLEHLNDTYYKGLVKQMDDNGDDKYLHGQFNQVCVATGRLSSSKPNLQNFDDRVRECLISRY